MTDICNNPTTLTEAQVTTAQVSLTSALMDARLGRCLQWVDDLAISHRRIADQLAAEKDRNAQLMELVGQMLPASEWMVERFEDGDEFNDMADDATETMEYVQSIVIRAQRVIEAAS